MFAASSPTPVWAGAAASTSFSPTDPFRAPSTRQAYWNNKHGIVSGQGIERGLSASSYIGTAQATMFFSGVDVEGVFASAWYGGFILHPNLRGKSRGHQDAIFMTTSSPLGGRALNGSSLVYS